MSRKVYPYTKEQLIQYLYILQKELGSRPKKADIPENIRPYYRVLFGKWIYALEEAGLSVPSEATLRRRQSHKARNRRTGKRRSKQPDGVKAK